MALPTATNVLNGPYNGYSAKQTITNYKDSGQVMMRRVLVKSWNTQGAIGAINGRKRIVTPFRAVNNLGDFLARPNYICGGPNQINKTYPGRQGPMGSIMSKCDGSGVPGASCNPKFVPDSSDYVTYKRQMAVNKNYNDLKNGGDQSNASYVARERVRR
jgi:hypothetical protein